MQCRGECKQHDSSVGKGTLHRSHSEPCAPGAARLKRVLGHRKVGDLSLHTLSLQVVRVLTVMLHRQWLTLQRAGGLPKTEQQKRTVRCLRDTVLLLHSLSQKDKLFTVHCVEVLHQFDQVMPGVSMLIRALPDVTDCEGEPLKGPSLPQPTWVLPNPCEQVRLLFRRPLTTTASSSTGDIVFMLWFFSENIGLPFAHLLSWPDSHGFSRTS